MEAEQRRTLRAPRASPQTNKTKISNSTRSASAAADVDGTTSAAAAAPSHQQQSVVRDRPSGLPPLQPGWKPKAGALKTVNTSRMLEKSKPWMPPRVYAKQQRFFHRMHVREAFRKHYGGRQFLQLREQRMKRQERRAKQQERKQRRSQILEKATTKTIEAAERSLLEPSKEAATPPPPPPKPTVLVPRKESKARPRKGMIFTPKPVPGGFAARKLVILPEGIEPKPRERSPVLVQEGNTPLPAQLEEQRRVPKQLHMVVRLAIAVVVVLAGAPAWNRSSTVKSVSTPTVESSHPTASIGEENHTEPVNVVPLEAAKVEDAMSGILFFYKPVKVIPLNATKDRVAVDNRKPKVIRLLHPVPPMVKPCEVVWLVPQEANASLSDIHHQHHRPLTKSLESSGMIRPCLRPNPCPLEPIGSLAREMVLISIGNASRSKRWREQYHPVNPTLLLDLNLTAGLASPSLFAWKLRFEHPRKKRKRRESPLLDLNLTSTINPSLLAWKLRFEHPRKKRKRREPTLLSLNLTRTSSPSLFAWKLRFEHPRKKRKRREPTLLNLNATTPTLININTSSVSLWKLQFEHPRKKRKRRAHKSPLLNLESVTVNINTSVFEWKLKWEHPRKQRKRKRRAHRSPLLDLESVIVNINTSVFEWKLKWEHPRKQRKRKRRERRSSLLDLESVTLTIPRRRSMKRPRKRKRWRCTSLSDFQWSPSVGCCPLSVVREFDSAAPLEAAAAEDPWQVLF